MIWLLYMIFSGGLFLWTVNSVSYEAHVPIAAYFAGVLILAVAVSAVYRLTKQASGRNIRSGLMIIAFLANMGLSIDYICKRVSEDVSWSQYLKSGYLMDLILMVPVFLLVYVIIRFTRLYKWKSFNVLAAAVLPIAIFGARMTGKKTGGSYLYFCGFMIFGLVLMGFPFVAAWFMSVKEDRYLAGNVKRISWDMIRFLTYCFLLYAGCAACNEFGLLLVLGLTSTVLFYVRCRDKVAKFLYTAACSGGAILAGIVITHLSDRIQIWLDPAAAYADENLRGKAESVLYLFRHLDQIGWWGEGIGSLSKRIYPTLNTDHALILLINDYSVILFGVVVFLGILLARWMLTSKPGLNSYDRFLNLSCGLILCFILLIDVASNLGSFITAGIGFPWVSYGSAVNIMLTCLAAIHCGVMGKKVKGYA